VSFTSRHAKATSPRTGASRIQAGKSEFFSGYCIHGSQSKKRISKFRVLVACDCNFDHAPHSGGGRKSCFSRCLSSTAPAFMQVNIRQLMTSNQVLNHPFFPICTFGMQAAYYVLHPAKLLATS
jgi:hypothetical protein